MLEWMNKMEEFDQTVYSRVKELSKSLVFRTHKFFTTQEDIDDYTMPLSPGAMIMNKLSVPQERRAAFWNQYKLGMKEGFDAQRQNVQTAIGNKWKGEKRWRRVIRLPGMPNPSPCVFDPPVLFRNEKEGWRIGG
jgi:hypothetical protein